MLLDRIEELGWIIFNENTKGDEEGEWTYTGGGKESIIDYVIGERELKDWVEKLEIVDKVDSDHHSVVMSIKHKEKRKRKLFTEAENKKGKSLDREGGARIRGKMGRSREGEGVGGYGMEIDEAKNREIPRGRRGGITEKS